MLAVECVIASMLMMPAPFYKPAAALCVFSTQNAVAKTVINTLSGVLALMLVAPAYEYWSISESKENKLVTDPSSPGAHTELASQLNMSLILAVVSTLFLTRHLGVVTYQRDEAQAVAGVLGDAVHSTESEDTAKSD